MTIHKKIRHPAGAKSRINPQSFNKWADFPKSLERNTYTIKEMESAVTEKAIRGRAKNRILLALIEGPLECACKVRIAMFVGLLRHECGLSIQTDEYLADNEPEGGAGVYGVYTLETKVHPVVEGVPA